MEVLSCSGRRLFLVCSAVLQLVLCGSGVYATNATSSCKLLYDSKTDGTVLSRLEPLANRNFTAVTKNGDQTTTYTFQLCGNAGGVAGAGLIQVDSKATTVIGRYDSTQVVGGDNWVLLIYRNGNPSPTGKRSASIIVSCNPKVDMGSLEVSHPQTEKEQDDFYYFKMDSSAACLAPQSKLSTGSILIIIGFCLLAVYLIGGFLYQRLIVGAKGMEQFPNYAFWVEFGNLTADGCDFVCRSRNREDSPTYRPVAPESLEEEEQEERDDHLLPM